MIELVRNNIAAIGDVCKEHYVRSLYLFGSAVSGQEFNVDSDIDFLYEIDVENFKGWDTGEYDYIDNLNDLEIRLNGLLERNIDLIPYRNIHNRFFKETVDSVKQLIYES